MRANPGLTLEEIARGVHQRTQAVRDVLVGEGFSSSLRMSHPSDRAKVYSVVVETREGPGRAARPSQCARIAQVLSDGHFHTASEIHRRIGFCRLNSRIAELRKSRGWDILCEHVPGQGSGPDAYRYRLVGTSEGDEAARGEGLIAPGLRDSNGAVGASSPSGASSTVAGAEAPDCDVQPSLWEAA